MMSTTYDELPYPPLSYVHTHPDRLATLATLLGLEPAPVEACRVLEVGCAAGSNLLPMAYYLPESRFVGIDASPRQIAEGQAWIATLGVKNLTLHAGDLLDVGPELGEFDYIIAHGFYSWVAPPVRDKLLQLCRDHLAPHGVAYISYNTYPGYHMTNMVREAMRYRLRTVESCDPLEQVAAARAVIHFLAQAAPPQQSAYVAFLQQYDEMLECDVKGSHAAFLLHDELAPVNDPLYFHQFVEHAARFGLQYLVEAELRTVFPHGFAPEVIQQIQALAPDTIALEQYLDLLRNRMFRQTLLCHAGAPVAHTLHPQRVQRCSVRSQLQPTPDAADLAAKSPVGFRSPDGQTLNTDHPVSKVALAHLGQIWPQALPFGTLLHTARQALALPTDPAADPEGWHLDARALATNLLQAYSYSDKLVGLHRHCPPITHTLGDRPAVSSLTRLQAQIGPFVTNRWHERIRLEPGQRQLVQWLDGTQTRAALAEIVMAEAQPEGEADEVARWLAAQLAWLEENGLAAVDFRANASKLLVHLATDP